MKDSIFKSLSFLWGLLFVTSASASLPAYHCHSPRPEKAGFHNMVLFGDPSDQVYAYHLPLFAGAVNGTDGHVLMHVYQGLWRVTFEAKTLQSYQQKFVEEKSVQNPIPFFSVSPRGNPFQLPEMICQADFQTQALVVYGHVEGHPGFPAPEPLPSGTSKMKVQSGPLLAHRFDRSSYTQLSYALFGSPQQPYLVHLLTDDENSFDQIVAIKAVSGDLAKRLEEKKTVLVHVSLQKNQHLVEVNSSAKSLHQRFKLPTKTSVENQRVTLTLDGTDHLVEVKAEIYFNQNSDLRVSGSSQDHSSH